MPVITNCTRPNTLKGLVAQFNICLLLVLLSLVLPQPGQAQSTYGTVVGTVMDSANAVTPRVSITITNVDTNISRTVQTNEEGNYEITNLLPGAYRLRAELTGFKTLLREGVVLDSRATVRVDLQMEVGETSVSVQVTAAPPAIETENAQIADGRNARQLEELPSVNTQETFAYLMTLPGVQSVGTFTYSFNGSRSAQYEFLIDGISSPRLDGPLGATHNTFEAIQEVKVHAANNSAEFGSPGAISLVTKSGTNQLHGSLFYFHNNSALNARSFFSAGKPVSKSHTFGFSLGGPVYIPKLYDGHNRTFFLLSYFGQRVPGSQGALATVPTAGMRGGDFAGLPAIRDPLTGAAFAGNRIPASRLNPIALRVQDRFYPRPNFGNPDLPVSNYFTLFTGKNLADKWDVRLDQKITDRNLLYVRVGYRSFPNQPLSNNLPTIGTLDGYRRTSSFVLSDTHTFTPNLINEFRLGTQRSNNRLWAPTQGLEVLRFTGLAGIAPANDVRGLPVFDIAGFNTIGPGFGLNAARFVNQLFEGTDVVTWIRGNHTFKTGIDLQRQYDSNINPPQAYFGSFSFNGFFTGNAYADFLLGLPKTASRATDRGPEYIRRTDLNLFVLDDWKVSPKLTVNWGLRYEYQFASTDKARLMYNLDPRTANLVVPDSVFNAKSFNPLLPGAIKVVSASQAGFPQTLRETDKNNFAPRLGLAFRPWDKTVLRAGYGVFIDTLGVSLTPTTGSPLFGFTETFENFDNRLPVYTFPNPFGTAGSIGTISANGFNVRFRNPYVQQWNLTAERELAGMGVRVSYIGTKGTNLGYTRNLNLPPPSTTPFDNSRRPFPQYRNLSFADNGGNSIYHGLQVDVERRFAQGLYYQAAWTWSNNISDIEDAGGDVGPSIENPFDRGRERGRLPYSVRHRLNGAFIYELPVGRGRRFLSGMPAVFDQVLGGWSLSSLFYFETGRFFTPSFSGRDISGTGISGGRPDRIANGNLSPGERRVERWFDLSAFTVPAANSGRFGTAGRNILEGPGMNLQHFSLIKRFYAREQKMNVQFQLNILNLFNHPNFTVPNANISTGSAGRVTGLRPLLEQAGPRNMSAELRINF